MTNTYGHTMDSVEKYFWGKYLPKLRFKKSNKKQFQLINRDVLVTPNEIFETSIGFDDELAIYNNERLHLTEQSSFLYLQTLFYIGFSYSVYFFFMNFLLIEASFP